MTNDATKLAWEIVTQCKERDNDELDAMTTALLDLRARLERAECVVPAHSHTREIVAINGVRQNTIELRAALRELAKIVRTGTGPYKRLDGLIATLGDAPVVPTPAQPPPADEFGQAYAHPWPNDPDPEWRDVPAERVQFGALGKGDRWWVNDRGPWAHYTTAVPAVRLDEMRWIKRASHPARKPPVARAIDAIVADNARVMDEMVARKPPAQSAAQGPRPLPMETSVGGLSTGRPLPERESGGTSPLPAWCDVKRLERSIDVLPDGSTSETCAIAVAREVLTMQAEHEQREGAAYVSECEKGEREYRERLDADLARDDTAREPPDEIARAEGSMLVIGTNTKDRYQIVGGLILAEYAESAINYAHHTRVAALRAERDAALAAIERVRAVCRLEIDYPGEGRVMATRVLAAIEWK